MLVRFKSLFDIYPDKIHRGAVWGYRKPDGSKIDFPCTLDVSDAVTDVKGRWTASSLGLRPVVVKYSEELQLTKAVEAWIGDGFGKNPDAKNPVHNKKLERVRFVDGVVSIGKAAFHGCTNLTEVTYGGTIEQWYAIGYAFPDISDITCQDGKAVFRIQKITSGGTDTVQVYGLTPHGEANCTEIIIPDGVTSIGCQAFYGYTGLTSITIPNGVTSVGYGAFEKCRSLESITIPDSVTTIGERAFLRCTGLTRITIPDGVTSIGRDAFEGCTRLTNITIPESVTEIGMGAFADCTRLASITILANVTKIKCQAFSCCTRLTNITIPESVTVIGSYAFEGCTRLTSIRIPESVTEIGREAFIDCNRLTDIYINQPANDLLDDTEFLEGCAIHWKQTEAV